jgi:hypothetical protein
MKSRLVFLTLFLLAGSAGADGGAPAWKPGDFAARFEIGTAGREPFQRVPLAAEVYRYSRSPQLSDLRVFNAAGEPLPHALHQPNARGAPRESAQGVAVYPVNADVHAAARGGGRMEIRQEAAGTTVVVIAGREVDAAQPADGTRVEAYLLDARTVKGQAVALDLDADFEGARLVPITLEASGDLKNWQTLAAGEPVFRLGEGAAGATRTTVRFARAAAVEQRFLRLRWTKSAHFALNAAWIRTLQAEAQPLVPDVALPIGAPLVYDGRTAEWAVPTPVAFSRMTVALAESNAVAPVKVLGRRNPGEPWLAIGRGVLYRLAEEGGERIGPPLEVAPGSYAGLKIAVEAPTVHLGAAPPTAGLHFAPREVIFLARGPAPYTLAAGNAGAGPAHLPLPSLIPGYAAEAERGLPLAGLGRPVIDAHLLPAAPRTLFGLDARRLVLWCVLIAAVLVLAAYALALLRKSNAARQTPPPG